MKSGGRRCKQTVNVADGRLTFRAGLAMVNAASKSIGFSTFFPLLSQSGKRSVRAGRSAFPFVRISPRSAENGRNSGEKRAKTRRRGPFSGNRAGGVPQARCLRWPEGGGMCSGRDPCRRGFSRGRSAALPDRGLPRRRSRRQDSIPGLVYCNGVRLSSWRTWARGGRTLWGGGDGS